MEILMKSMNLEVFKSKIIKVRGVEVMLANDVAEALGVEARYLNQNAKESPKWDYVREHLNEDDFRFQLTEEELNTLPTASDYLARYAQSHSLPWVYTELGCAHFGTSLTSEEACILAIQLSKSFVYIKNKGNALVDLIPREIATRYLKTDVEAAQILGCSISTARTTAVNVVRQKFKEDFSMYLIENIADVQELKVTPSELGEMLEEEYKTQLKPKDTISNQKVNKVLAAMGFQEEMIMKGKKKWSLTDKGNRYGVYIDVVKKQQEDVMIHTRTDTQQLKWRMTPTFAVLKQNIELFGMGLKNE